MMRVMWIVSGWFVLTLTTHAASLIVRAGQCRHMICASPYLSQLDKELNTAYQEVFRINHKMKKLAVATTLDEGTQCLR